MSDLQKAFDTSRRKLSGSTAAVRGNLILRATEFTADTVKGEVLTGKAAGTEIEVKYAGTLDQQKYTKKSSKSFVDTTKGGTVRIEGVTEGKDGVYNARWMVSFNGKPVEGKHNVIPDAVCNYVDTGRRDNEDRPKVRVNQLMIDAEQHVKSLEDLQSAIEKGFADEGAVTLFGADNDGNIIQAPFYLSGSINDGKWVANDPAERAAETIESFGDAIEQVKEVLGNGGFSVVPMRGFSVGPTTAEMVEASIEEAAEKGVRARISTIDPQNWVCPTIGMRLQSALNQKGDDALPEGTADRLEAAFKSYADKEETGIFESKGWRGLSNDTLTKFFASAGVELKKHPSTGWTEQALLEDKLDGMDRGFIVKGFQLKATAPYPAVEACADARAAFYSEMKDAAEAAVANLRAEAGAKSDAPKAATAEEKAAPADELPADEGDALDDLLNDVADDMELNG